MKLIIYIIALSAIQIFSQSERYTKGAENGYAWLAMDDPTLYYSISKENYLSSILERMRITKEKHPEIASLTCGEDIHRLANQGNTSEISISDVVIEIDNFYSEKENLIIPIVFAYCYTIKKFSGASNSRLDDYKSQVLEFCKE